MNKRETMAVFLAVWFALICATSPAIAYDREQNGIQLNAASFAYARDLINQGRVVADKRGEWKLHQPSTTKENEFIRQHGFDEYGKWYLGIDDRYAKNTKRRYKFPYGDFQNVHRCALLAVRARARQYGYGKMENAVAELERGIKDKPPITTRLR